MPERPEPRAEPTHQRLRARRSGRLLVGTCRAHLYLYLYLPGTRHARWAVQP